MGIDPASMMAISTALMTLVGGLTGEKGKQGSTHSKKQLKGLEGIMEDIKSMKGGAQDITQQPGYQQGNQWLMSMFNDPEFFNRFEAPLQRQFEENTIPDLANRFASMGSGGSLGSTGFRNQLAREGSNLSTNIAAQRGGMMQQAIPQLLGYAQQPFSNLMSLQNLAYGQGTQNTYQPPSTGFFGGMAPAFANATAQMYGGQGGGGGNTGGGGAGYGAGWDNLFRDTGVPGQSASTY